MVLMTTCTLYGNNESQIRELTEVAERRGWTVVEIYRGASISRAKGRDKRRGLDAESTPRIPRRHRSAGEKLASWRGGAWHDPAP
jgi:hypothetical protein